MFEVSGTTRLPYSAICYIVCVFPDGSRSTGSGTVVGVNDVLTAMHVVYNLGRGGFATSISIYPGADTQPTLTTPLGTYTDWGRLSGRTNNWDQNGDRLLTPDESQYDLALIGLRSRIGDVTGILATSAGSTGFTGTSLGYPGLGTGLMAERMTLSTASGSAVFYSDSTLGPGASGGPVLNDANQVLGVNSAGNSSGTSGYFAGLFGPGNYTWMVDAINANDTLIGGSATPAPTPAPAPSGATRVGTAGDDTFFFSRFDAAGLITVSDPGGRDIFNAYLVAGTQRIDLNPGAISTIGNNTVIIQTGSTIEDAMSYDGDDVLIGNSAGNTFFAEGGNDQLKGGGGNDYLDGGAGIDTAVYANARVNYSVDVSRKTVTDLQAGRDGVDSLNNVERLQFSDVYLALDTAGNGGQAYRLYQAAFDRTPDRPGLGYQMHQLDIGARLVDVAQGFIASAEFSQSFGTLDTAGFVARLYQNVLHRAPDAGGLAFHTSAVASGTSRAQLLVNFSESPENQAAVIGVIQNGMVYTL